MDHVLLTKKPGKKIVVPKVDKSGTPMWESTLTETLGIRKFIEMSIADVRMQLEHASQSLPKRKFDEQKLSALIVTAWLTSALAMVDEMLAEAAATSKTSLAEQKKREQTNGN